MATAVADNPIQAGKEKLHEAVGGPARLQIVLVLATILALDAAEKATVSAVAGALKQTFDLNNTDVGLLIAVSSLAGAVLTLPVGVLVDRFNRRRIIMIAILLWTVAMVVSGFASSFLFLLLTRVALGGVTAAAAPTVASLTGDYFPGRDRTSIYGIILAGELVGTGIGFFLSGEISSALDWHWSFYLMAVPSLLALGAIWMWLPEPARGGQSAIDIGEVEVPSREKVAHDPERQQREPQESASSEKAQKIIRRRHIEPREKMILDRNPARRNLFWVLGYLLRLPTYWLVIIASSLAYYFFAGVRAFAMIYLTQHYNLDRATVSWLVIPVGVGALLGALLIGRLTRRMLDRGYVASRVVVPGIALVLAALFFAPAVWVTSAAIGTTLLVFGAFAFASANPPLDAARLDIVTPRMWGRAEAGRMALRGLLEGGAPLLFGYVSRLLGGGGAGLELTFLLMLIPMLIAAALAIPAYFTYPRDVATAGASIRRIKEREEQEQGEVPERARSPARDGAARQHEPADRDSEPQRGPGIYILERSGKVRTAGPEPRERARRPERGRNLRLVGQSADDRMTSERRGHGDLQEASGPAGRPEQRGAVRILERSGDVRPALDEEQTGQPEPRTQTRILERSGDVRTAQEEREHTGQPEPRAQTRILERSGDVRTAPAARGRADVLEQPRRADLPERHGRSDREERRPRTAPPPLGGGIGPSGRYRRIRTAPGRGAPPNRAATVAVAAIAVFALFRQLLGPDDDV